MDFAHRSFPGIFSRPKPECYFDNQYGLLIVATSWSHPELAAQLITNIKDTIQTLADDNEITMPFERLSYLSKSANDLRAAALLINSQILSKENKSEFLAGVELTIIHKGPIECAWLQAGQPHICLGRKNAPLVPIATSIDLSFSLGSGDLAPLPSRLLGMDERPEISAGSFRCFPEDEIWLLSHSQLPLFLLNEERSEDSLELVTKQLAHHHGSQPFWLGRLQL